MERRIKRQRVLVIDDEPVIRNLLSDVLREEGLDVVTVTGGEEGIERVREEEFDLVFTDIHLADVNGIEVLKALRGLRRCPPVVLMDSYPDGLVERGLSLGAWGCLHKPFELYRLRAILEDLIG